MTKLISVDDGFKMLVCRETVIETDNGDDDDDDYDDDNDNINDNDICYRQ